MIVYSSKSTFFGRIVRTPLTASMDSFSFFASPTPSTSGSCMRTSTSSVYDDRTFLNSQIALYQKLDKINKDVQHLAETSAQQTCSKPQTSKLPRDICVSCLHTISILIKRS